MFDDVWACGPIPGEDGSIPASAAFSVPPFITDRHGYQCTELANRYLFHVTGHYIADNPSGHYFVMDAARDFGFPLGSPAPGSLPAVGDILSEWGGEGEPLSGHVGVVTSIEVDAQGDGTIYMLNENGAGTFDRLSIEGWEKSSGYAYYDWLDPTSSESDPIITTRLLPRARVGVAYQAYIAVTAGAAPYSWSLVSGSLPAGIHLDLKTGVLRGDPRRRGSVSFIVSVEGSNRSVAAIPLLVDVKGG
jgi:hypothetical protein